MDSISIIQFALAFLLAGLASFLLTPLMKKLAIRVGFVDRPDGGRKTHSTPIALGGGAVIFVATLLAILVVFSVAFPHGHRDDGWTSNAGRWTALLGAALIIVAVGLIDDRIGLRGWHKLLGQLLAAAVLVSAGFRIDKLSLFGAEFSLDWMAIPFAMFWLLGSINAVNLIDGIDGLASSVGFVLCLTMAAITGQEGYFAVAMLMLALAGALLGFLRFNFAPATIYLGDAGSMLIGLVIGAAAIFAKTKGAAVVALAVPVAVWCIPILDSSAAILRRKLTGRSLFAADRGHLHHSLLVRGWSVRQAVLFIGLIATTTCLSAVMSFYYDNELIALVTVAAMAVFLVGTKTFGHIEFALLKHHIQWTAHALKAPDNTSGKQTHQSCIHLQGSQAWDKLWEAMIESAADYRLVRVMLNVNIPPLHEAFYATWDCRAARKDVDKVWKIANPLVVEEQIVGNIEISGMANGGSAFPHMIQVLDYIEAVESDIQHVMEGVRESHSQSDATALESAGSPCGEPVQQSDAAPIGPTHWQSERASEINVI